MEVTKACASLNGVRLVTKISNQQIAYNLAMDISETDIASAKAERQSSMVEPELMQHCRMQVVNRHRVLGNRVAEFVGRSVGEAFFEPSACYEDAVAVHVVVAAGSVGDFLSMGSAPHFPAQITIVVSKSPVCFKS